MHWTGIWIIWNPYSHFFVYTDIIELNDFLNIDLMADSCTDMTRDKSCKIII